MDDMNSSANLLIFKGKRYCTSRHLLKNPKKTVAKHPKIVQSCPCLRLQFWHLEMAPLR